MKHVLVARELDKMCWVPTTEVQVYKILRPRLQLSRHCMRNGWHLAGVNPPDADADPTRQRMLTEVYRNTAFFSPGALHRKHKGDLFRDEADVIEGFWALNRRAVEGRHDEKQILVAMSASDDFRSGLKKIMDDTRVAKLFSRSNSSSGGGQRPEHRGVSHGDIVAQQLTKHATYTAMFARFTKFLLTEYREQIVALTAPFRVAHNPDADWQWLLDTYPFLTDSTLDPEVGLAMYHRTHKLKQDSLRRVTLRRERNEKQGAAQVPATVPIQAANPAGW
jgi:hypothetical protein